VNRRRTIVGALILLVLIVGGIVGAKSLQDHQAVNNPSNHLNEEIIGAITRDNPTLVYQNKPVIEVVSTKQFEGKWYVVTIKSIHEKTMPVPVKVVLLDQGEPDHILTALLGPDVHFTDSEMGSANLPDSVMLELEKP
jgi:hypothetical protein